MITAGEEKQRMWCMGKPWGILAGDGLLNYAFETALKAFEPIPAYEDMKRLTLYERVAKAMQVLSQKAGIHGMIGRTGD